MPCVYALRRTSSPMEYRYVGVTRHETPYPRLKGHIAAANRGSKYPVYCWMRKHAEDIEVVMLDHASTMEEAFSIEILRIYEFKEKGHRLLNVTAGGEGCIGLTHSDTTKNKISDSLKGRVFSAEHLEKIRLSNTGRTRSKEAKNNMSKAQKGRLASEETKKKMSEAHEGKKHSEASKAKMVISQNNRILSEEARDKISKANSKPKSKETKRKISEALKNRNKEKRVGNR